MNIEFDGPVSSANATLIRQVIEALIQREQVRTIRIVQTA